MLVWIVRNWKECIGNILDKLELCKCYIFESWYQSFVNWIAKHFGDFSCIHAGNTFIDKRDLTAYDTYEQDMRNIFSDWLSTHLMELMQNMQWSMKKIYE